MADLHSVLGITLPPSDANLFFIVLSRLAWDAKKELPPCCLIALIRERPF
jgi:hypothetical protein